LDKLLGGPQSRSGRRGEEKILSSPYRDSNFDPLVVQLVASRYTDYAVPICLEVLKKTTKDISKDRLPPSDYKSRILPLHQLA
jgi:hypothetical protein